MKKGIFKKFIVLGLASVSFVAMAEQMVVYKSIYCGCCSEWVNYMRKNGFTDIKVINTENFISVKKEHKIPSNMYSCHTAVIGNKVIEGHIPVQDVKALLDSKNNLRIVAAPGMPPSSPGMDIPGTPYQTFGVNGFGQVSVLSEYDGSLEY